MDYLIFISVLLATGAIIFLNWYFARQTQDKMKQTSEEIKSYARIQKENTEKLISILDKTFVPLPKPTKNNIETKDDSIEFSENNPLELKKDIKFQVEGGDSIIPPGYR